MELRDLIVTPIVVLLVFLAAYIIRPFVTDSINYKYYFPALSLKIFGAIMLGVIYQFYYGGGDTFAYHTHGSRHIWEAFMESSERGFELLFSNGEMHGRNWDISEKIWYFRDQKSFVIIRIATVLDLLTFSSYSGTATLFAVLSFVGGWMLFLTFYKKYPALHGWLAFSCLFIPSIVFWGSGILKDTVTLSFLCIATYCVNRLFIEWRINLRFIFLLLFSLFVIFSVKVYILMCFLAGALLWIFSKFYFRIENIALRLLAIPFVVLCVSFMGYKGISEIVEDDPRYSLNNLAETVRVTAYDIRYWTGKDAGSGYSLGELDGTFGSVARLAPAAVNVSLFRPYLWEVKNPLMLLSALESLLNFLFTLFILIKIRTKIFRYMQIPEVFFCVVFAIIFAFGVGVSTYNFGTLARYKIPLMPFYLIGLGIIYYAWKNDKKVVPLDSTE
ncbi:hypothetical protein [Pseudochryseolinea flava]|uniref:Glycosyltransferase RgtA/B/C/D-like domain-containing protein n=1 Tax=Pseudochryseolinea flava TaxID=2059302 RepID=A0A364Y8H6_9BACT|nr:hypothetical protein [Pseudochryseolinea flava]RAW02659.1 hypothetical protein DQQ10_00690 [Pseudochryseolinea flava]